MANIKQTVDFSQGTLNNLVVVNNKLQLPSVAAPQFTRNSIAYKNDGTLVNTNLPRFETGKFGKAIMVEEGTENLCPNPSFETGITGWTSQFYDGVFERDTSESYHGIACVKCKSGTDTRHRAYFTVDLQTGEQIRLSAYAKTIAEDAVNLSIEYDGGDYSWKSFSGAFHTGSGEWERLFVAGEIATSDCTAYCFIINSSAENFAYFDAVQAEKKPYSTSFTDGTRGAETLTIPTAGVLNPQEGTIECWVYVPEFWEQGIPYWRRIWSIGMYVLYYAPDTGKIHFTISNSSGGDQIISVNKPTVGWHFFAAKWSASEMALFIDGVKVGSITNPNLPSNFAVNVISIGCRPDYPYDNVNTLIDDLRISSRARTDEEIAAAYQSGQPLPIDEYTTYLLRFDGALNFGRGGYYISPEYDLSTVGNYVKHRVYWQEDADKGECLVYAKLDNQSDWTQLTNGGSLPIVVGQDLTGRNIQFKAKLLDLV